MAACASSSIAASRSCRSSFSPALVDGLKEMAPHVAASAVVGVNTLRRLMFRTITLFSGRAIAAFETREQALDWRASFDRQ